MFVDGWVTDSVTMAPYKYIGSTNGWYFEGIDKPGKVPTNLVLRIMDMLNRDAAPEMPKASYHNIQPKDFKIDLSNILWENKSSVAKNHKVNWQYYVAKLKELGLNVHAYDPTFTISDDKGNSCVIQLWVVKVLLGEK